MGRKPVAVSPENQYRSSDSSPDVPRTNRDPGSRGKKQRDALLTAAAAGWGTTFRYALLVLVTRGSAIAGTWVAFELARHLGKLG